MSTLDERAAYAASNFEADLKELISELSDTDWKVVESFGRVEGSAFVDEESTVDDLQDSMERGLATLYRRGALSITTPKSSEAQRQLAALLRAHPAPVIVTKEPVPDPAIAERQELEEFANSWNWSSTPKLVNGKYSVGRQAYTPLEMEAMFEKAENAGLIKTSGRV